MIERGKFYRIRETKEAIRSGTTKTYHLIAQKKLAAFKSGRATLITGESILDYLESLPRAEVRTGLSSKS